MTAHLYKSGDDVAVFDTRRGRWVKGSVLSATLASALVQTARWWGFIPADPQLLRPMRVISAEV